MFLLIYELRKNWHGWTGRVNGWTGGRVDGTGIEGSIRGPRGPKKSGRGGEICDWVFLGIFFNVGHFRAFWVFGREMEDFALFCTLSSFFPIQKIYFGKPTCMLS